MPRVLVAMLTLLVSLMANAEGSGLKFDKEVFEIRAGPTQTILEFDLPFRNNEAPPSLCAPWKLPVPA
jgi:hypothetical protein